MAKITDLAAVDAINGDEFLPIVQGGATKRATMTALRALIVPFLQAWYKGDPGNPGPAGNVAITLAQLRAAPVTNGTMIAAYDGSGSTMTWTPGDFTAQAARWPMNYERANAVPLTQGAWVRQAAGAVDYDGRSIREKISEIRAVTDTRFAAGARSVGEVDNALALAAALAPANAGYKAVPAGVYSSSIVRQILTPGAPHHLDGDGPGISVFRKLVDDESILFDLEGSPTNLDNHSVLSNFSVDNGFRGRRGTGLRMTNTGRQMLRNVVFDGLGAGWYVRGALLINSTGVTFRGCGTGYTQERGPGYDPGDGSTAYIYPNMNRFYGGAAIGNPILGFDIAHGSGFGLHGVNVEGNGTSGDTSTGGMIIRPSIAAETGFGTMEVSGHFERNAGFGGLLGQDLTGLILHVHDSDFVSNEAARDAAVSGAWSIGLTSNHANGVMRIQARMSFVQGGLYNTLIDTSDDWVHHTETADGKRVMWMSQFRVNHSRSAPTADDTVFAPGNRTRVGGLARDTHIGKYGSGLIRMGGVLKDNFAIGKDGIAFFNRAQEGTVALPEPSPPPAASAASAHELANAIRARLIALGLWD